MLVEHVMKPQSWRCLVPKIGTSTYNQQELSFEEAIQMARKKGPPIEEKARDLAGNKGDKRFDDPVKGVNAKTVRDLESKKKRI